MVVFEVHRDYGYVVLVGIGSAFVAMWHGIIVGSARRKYDIKYPIMYSGNNIMFDCIQRAHGNYLENYSQFLFLLLVGGIEYPRFSAACGVMYLLGRIVYTLGYATGDPKKRLRGVFFHAASLGLMYASGHFALSLLGYV